MSDRYALLHGDCLEVLKELPDNSIDALVTDPPAGISFMGKAWDWNKGGRKEWVAWMEEVMRECLRVMKPGAHGLVWALPRTSHWAATALEDAGFEIRDCVYHLFGQGFPKSLDVSKAIDKAAGAEREVLGVAGKSGSGRVAMDSGTRSGDLAGQYYSTVAATDDAKKWQGWGTALKPAVECWWLVRKPCSEKTVAANVLKWGTGAINIDASRIDGQPRTTHKDGNKITKSQGMFTVGESDFRPATPQGRFPSPQGRFPSHLILDEESAEMVGEPSRFFYCAKISSSERGKDNKHPTVKPQKLMRYLIRMVTPPNGTVLDPFTGSGSTGVAALAGGFQFLGIEREAEYVAIAEKRIEAAA